MSSFGLWHGWSALRVRAWRLGALTGLAAVLLVMAAARPAWRVDVTAAQQPARTGPAGTPLKVLFLGQDEERPHNPAAMYPLLAAPLARKGIQLTYVATPAEALTPDTLQYYDALMIYGNHTSITPAEEQALVDFVEGGKGLVAIHSASAEFTNSDKYIALIGGEFQRHGTGEFTAGIVQPNHPVMQGVTPFNTWDETYVHTKHNPVNRTVLMERVDASGREPWTWVRTQGKGRVFYTAYGHDERTWSQPEFTQLIENAVSWTVDEAARQAWMRVPMPEVKYVAGYDVPNYEQRDPAPQFQLPFSPQDSQRFIQAPGEFDVRLFASEPDVVKPITMTFDERGRLWVIEALDYPNEVLLGNPGDDIIKILEDTNDDGRADKVTVFADHLNLASSLTFGNGGVIVAAAPNFLFLKDTDGDDRADVREVLSTGWGTRDTHAGPSNLQYGPDNHIWGVVGYSGFNGEMNGTHMQFTQGAYRFKPDGSQFEYMTQSTNNTWGLGFNETFDVFGSTANGDPSWYMGIPNRFFDGVDGLPTPGGRGGSGPGYQSLAQFTAVHHTTPYIRQVDNMGYYTAGAGHMIYTARQFPKAYWNRIAFVNEPTVHITGQVVLESQGAGYVARDGWNLLSGAEEWFAPVQAQVGPDGAVWVSDWYNFIAQHNPTPTGYSTGRGAAYETSMRDHLRGRIYRIVYKGATPSPKRSLSKSDPAGLLAALASDNMFWRLTAQRLLVERGQKDVVPQLVALVRSRSVDAIGLNGGAFHALWTLQGLGELDTTTTEAYRAAVEALKHPSAGVRKAAAMVLPHAAAASNALLSAGLLQDPDLHTRLAATLVLAEMPASPDVSAALFKASQLPENFTDPWLGRALYIAATRQQQDFLVQYRNDPDKLPFSSLSVPLRIGNLKPDWRMPPAADLAADWKDIDVPGNWEAHGLPNFDGVVWFTRTVNLPAGASADSLSLGAVRNTAEVWLNGVEVSAGFGRGGRAGGGAPQGRGRGAGAAPAQAGLPLRPTATAMAAELTYPVPKDTLHQGANTITVRIQNNRAEGGFVGTPADLFLLAGQARTSLAGTWKYRVERSANTGSIYARPGELAAHVAFTAAGGATGAAASALPTVAAVPDVTLQLGVVPSQMKYSTTELTVQAGQMVEVVFSNTDEMQHNFVLGAPGSLQAIGAAADQLAARPGAVAQSYVPDVAQVLVKTALLNPGQTLRFQFRAPAAAGQYPYMCTFPAHWRIMNGVLNVVEPFRGRGAGGRGAQPAAPAGAGRGGRAGQ
jgi:putative membrane-bound dehydrogenase-like protein